MRDSCFKVFITLQHSEANVTRFIEQKGLESVLNFFGHFHVELPSSYFYPTWDAKINVMGGVRITCDAIRIQMPLMSLFI